MKLNREFSIRRRQVEAKFFDLISIRRFVAEASARGRLKKMLSRKEKFTLNKEQQNVATSYAPETLVVAGAGTGKTSVLIGRCRYLFLDKRAKPKRILLLAFNRKAVDEINERAKLLNLPIDGFTFHGFARKVIEDAAIDLGENSPSIFSSVASSKAVAFENDLKVEIFITKCIEDMIGTELGTQLLDYFSRFMIPQYNHDHFSTIEEYAQFVRSGIPVTLKNERVKSHGEWLISNYLYVNRVPYEYEAVYEGLVDRKSWHRPDFSLENGICIEYFGIDKDGGVAPGIDAVKYNEQISWKRSVHKSNKSILIELTFQDLKDGILIRKLEESLFRFGVTLDPMPPDEIIEVTNELGYTTKLIALLRKFLGFYRGSQLGIDQLLGENTKSERRTIFLNLFGEIYGKYLSEMENQNHPDFTGLIIEASKILNEIPGFLHYDHVMVDEFQDISAVRWRLLESIFHSNPSIVYTFVGDDWQAINEFAGSDSSFMLSMGNWSKGRKRVYLSETFRMPTSLCVSSGEFIMQNSNQIPKELLSSGPYASFDPSLVFHWDVSTDSSKENIKQVIERIGNDSSDPKCELLILARYTKNLPKLKDVDSLWKGPVQVMTVHRSKGLEADYVIIVDVNSSGGGFPSVIQDDPLLDMVRSLDGSFKHAGERRVLYVGLTRARRACHVASSIGAPSAFALEFKDSESGMHIGFEESKISTCPVCKSGFLTINKKLAGYGCTNWPVCGFRTPPCPTCSAPMQLVKENDVGYRCLVHSEARIERCPKCEWGALLLISGPTSNFLGCHLWATTRCKGSRSVNEGEKKSKSKKIKKVEWSPDVSYLSGSRIGKRWSETEDVYALTEVQAGRPIFEVAEKLGRNETAVMGRVCKWIVTGNSRLDLDVSLMEDEIVGSSNSWTLAEVKDLKSLWKSGLNIDEMCRQLKRAKHATLYQLISHHQIIPDVNSFSNVKEYYHSLDNKDG